MRTKRCDTIGKLAEILGSALEAAEPIQTPRVRALLSGMDWDQGAHLRPRSEVHEEILAEMLRAHPALAPHSHEAGRCVAEALDLMEDFHAPGPPTSLPVRHCGRTVANLKSDEWLGEMC